MIFWFIIASLASWRIARFIIEDNGPWNLFGKFRDKFGTEGIAKPGSFADLIGCYYCLGLYTSVPFAIALGNNLWEMLAYLFALSAAVVIVNIVIKRIGE